MNDWHSCVYTARSSCQYLCEMSKFAKTVEDLGFVSRFQDLALGSGVDGENVDWPDVNSESKWTARLWDEKQYACPFRRWIEISQPMRYEVVHEFLHEFLLVLRVFLQWHLDKLDVWGEVDFQWRQSSSWTGRK